MKLRNIIQEIPLGSVPNPGDLRLLVKVKEVEDDTILSLRESITRENGSCHLGTLKATLRRLAHNGWLTKNYELSTPVELPSEIDPVEAAKAAALSKFLSESGLTIEETLRLLDQLSK